MLNPLSCLDVWLDNVLHNVEESAICYHVNGVVKEYKLLRTEDIAKQELFEPEVVKSNALRILSFLKSNCTKQGGTYWIFKDSEHNSLQLYDLSSEEDEEDTPSQNLDEPKG
jgi:hypothetical protein